MLKRIHIRNYRVFREFDMDFTDGLNILVGPNDSGKSTLLEAVQLALTSRFRGRLLATELSPFMFNKEAEQTYLNDLANGGEAKPPDIMIDLWLAENEATASLKGTNNHWNENVPGLRIRARFCDDYASEYEQFVETGEVALVPAEYYQVDWVNFAGNGVTARAVPVRSSMVDAAGIRLHSGADYHLQRIIQEQLSPAERVELSRVYRSVREKFSEDDAIKSVNEKLAEDQAELTDKDLSLSIDISERSSWESHLVPHLDDLPLQFIGGGGQNMFKTLLAMNKTAETDQVVLVEEPENHQAPGALNILVAKISERCAEKQVLVSTHSSFVLNKLGLNRLALLAADRALRLGDLPPETLDYFKKLAGYDTLRLVLAGKALLVEGPSDELVVQRAYWDAHVKLPADDGVDVISVRGLSAKRFLDIGAPLGKTVGVIVDNDGASTEDVAEKYEEYTSHEGSTITLHVGSPEQGATLEPQLVSSAGREALNQIVGRDFSTDEELIEFMKKNKTTCALRIFESETRIEMPAYIKDAVA